MKILGVGRRCRVPIRAPTPLRGLLDAGIAVAPGERFRLRSQPAVRITITTLEPEDAERIADTLERTPTPQHRTLVN
jgi:hypothetical protein